MKVRALLREKARPVHTIASNQSVDDAINLMTAKQASALIVTENDQPVGIFAERDVFRYYLRDRSAALSEIALQNAMTDKLIVAEAEDDVSRVMAIMIKADIKHLPIIEEKKIIGMLKLNDLIEQQIESFTHEIHQLKDYIEDLHEAGRD
jgi:CBS domain-containing protein